MKRSGRSSVKGMVYYIFTDEAHRDIRGSVRAYRNAVRVMEEVEASGGERSGEDYEYLAGMIRAGYELGRDKRTWKNEATELVNKQGDVK